VLVPAVLSLALAAAAADAPAPQPALNPLKLCYVSVETAAHTWATERVTASGYGFRPGASVDVTLDNLVVLSNLVVDDTGQLPPHGFDAPVRHHGQRRFTVGAYDREDPSIVATQRALVSALAVRVHPRRARPSQKVHFVGRGFTDRGAIYAHYSRHGRLLRTVRLARASSGPCGTFSARRRQFPFRPRQGAYLVQIDQHRRLTDDGPLVRLTIDVRRRPAQ
jgi:hypothetical protein